MKRILFVAEAVTLAQVVRLATLARALDPRRYEVHFASARFDELVFGGAPFARHPIFSLAPELVESRVARGQRLYGRRTLARYLSEERALLAAVRPDLVVGDLRLSLAVSAPLEGVPHACLINAYWSPRAERDGWPMPDHPIVRWLGVERAAAHFPKALPFLFRHFAAPVNDLRRAHGLPEIGDLPNVLTHGDHVLYPDVPGLTPVRALAPRERYLGPVLWSPPVPLPPWWGELAPERATVYVTLGSSGRVRALPLVVEAAASLGCQVLVATAGRATLTDLPRHVYVADYLPGHLAARRAQVVVSNGGSTTSYQALAEGRPVLGVPSNLDQYLAMSAIERAGAGLHLRAAALTREQVRGALERLLGDGDFTARAAAASEALGRWPAAERFRAFVAAVVDGNSDGARPRTGAFEPIPTAVQESGRPPIS
jgi:UDP:flavonoid glycosyltransferase YjiC (YdhE family)